MQKGLAQVIKCKEGSLVKTNFDNYTQNVEAILINPRWNTSDKKLAKPDGSITVDDFAQF